MRRLFIFVNGICSDPASIEWTDRAVAWINSRTLDYADKYEYDALPLTRRLTQNKHAEALAKLVNLYIEPTGGLVLVGHSNGCDLILRALPLIREQVHTLHLISGACEADFESNGLNDLLRRCRVLWVCVWRAGRDRALQLAWWSRVLTLGMAGYGGLGQSGPLNVRPTLDYAVQEIVEPSYGHSAWFLPQHWELTMQRLTAG